VACEGRSASALGWFRPAGRPRFRCSKLAPGGVGPQAGHGQTERAHLVAGAMALDGQERQQRVSIYSSSDGQGGHPSTGLTPSRRDGRNKGTSRSLGGAAAAAAAGSKERASERRAGRRADKGSEGRAARDGREDARSCRRPAGVGWSACS